MESTRYEGRETSQELNELLYGKAMGFINEVSGSLANLGYDIDVSGSLAKGQAVHKRGSSWYVKDIDFRLSKNGNTLSSSEAKELRTSPWFFQSVQRFLRELKSFYSAHDISTGILEADFIYGSGLIPGTFAIGINSSL